MRKQALGQVEAAKGVPVEWRVHKQHVKAFKRVVGDINGLKIKAVD